VKHELVDVGPHLHNDTITKYVITTRSQQAQWRHIMQLSSLQLYVITTWSQDHHVITTSPVTT